MERPPEVRRAAAAELDLPGKAGKPRPHRRALAFGGAAGRRGPAADDVPDPRRVEEAVLVASVHDQPCGLSYDARTARSAPEPPLSFLRRLGLSAALRTRTRTRRSRRRLEVGARAPTTRSGAPTTRRKAPTTRRKAPTTRRKAPTTCRGGPSARAKASSAFAEPPSIDVDAVHRGSTPPTPFMPLPMSTAERAHARSHRRRRRPGECLPPGRSERESVSSCCAPSADLQPRTLRPAASTGRARSRVVRASRRSGGGCDRTPTSARAAARRRR